MIVIGIPENRDPGPCKNKKTGTYDPTGILEGPKKNWKTRTQDSSGILAGRTKTGKLRPRTQVGP